MNPSEFPILECDPDAEGIIEPRRVIDPIEIPERCVICFFQEVFASLLEEERLREIVRQRSEIGTHPIYEMNLDGTPLALFHPGVGSPLAAALFEEVIARGSSKFIACGGAGVLDRNIALGHFVVPSSAVRDEGTSYHYLPAGREVPAHPQAVAALEGVLRRHDHPYLVGKTWTTDAVYRETPTKVQARRNEGCLVVEMEAAALFAVAQFRRVVLGQVLYGGDDVSGTDWDHRHWDSSLSVRKELFWLAAEACLQI